MPGARSIDVSDFAWSVFTLRNSHSAGAPSRYVPLSITWASRTPSCWIASTKCGTPTGTAPGHFFVINTEGDIVYSDVGDCAFGNIESVIQDLLRNEKNKKTLPELTPAAQPFDEPGLPLLDATPTVRTGYEGDSIGNEEGFEPHRVVSYEIPPKKMEEGRFYLNGKWLNHRFSVAVAKAHDGPEASIEIPYTARVVNVVIHPQGDIGFSVNLELNGQPLSKTTCGDDVRLSGRGAGRTSVLIVSEARMYQLVKHEKLQSGVLKMSSRSGGLAIYSFSFSSTTEKDGEKPIPMVKALVGNRAKAKKSVVVLAKAIEKELAKEEKEEKKKAKAEAKEAPKKKAAAKKTTAKKAAAKKEEDPKKEKTSSKKTSGKKATAKKEEPVKADKKAKTKKAAAKKAEPKKAAAKKTEPKKAAAKKTEPKKAAAKKAEPKKAAAKKTEPKKAAAKKAEPKKAAAKKAAPKKAAAKKAAPKKAAAKKAEPKKAAAKKAAPKKAAAKKTVAKKAEPKKAAPKKAAAKKTAPKKAASKKKGIKAENADDAAREVLRTRAGKKPARKTKPKAKK